MSSDYLISVIRSQNITNGFPLQVVVLYREENDVVAFGGLVAFPKKSCHLTLKFCLQGQLKKKKIHFCSDFPAAISLDLCF